MLLLIKKIGKKNAFIKVRQYSSSSSFYTKQVIFRISVDKTLVSQVVVRT